MVPMPRCWMLPINLPLSLKFQASVFAAVFGALIPLCSAGVRGRLEFVIDGALRVAKMHLRSDSPDLLLRFGHGATFDPVKESSLGSDFPDER